MCLGSNLLLDEIFTLKRASINEILGVTVDRELKIDKHVKHVPKKAGNKLNILKVFQRNTPFKFFIKDQFNYCLLLRMFCSRSSSNLINKIHERALSLTTAINDIPFNELLSIIKEVSIQKKKIIKTLLIEVYKNLNGLLPPIMLDLFTTREILKLFKKFKKL